VTQLGRSFLGIDDQNGSEIFSDLRGFGDLSFWQSGFGDLTKWDVKLTKYDFNLTKGELT
jgi:hypothetical protein